jgi:hypothetical protein
MDNPLVGVAMTDGKFGFSLDRMIDRNEIILDTPKNRKAKLEKLCSN